MHAVRLFDKDSPEAIDVDLIIAIRNGNSNGIAEAIGKGAPFDRFAREALAGLFDKNGLGYWRAVLKGRVAGKPPKPPFTFHKREIEIFHALRDARQRLKFFDAAIAEVGATYKIGKTALCEIWRKYTPEDFSDSESS
jgi:hypothetical protein